MSSAGQPEDNDVTRRQDPEAQVRYPAGGARLRRRRRTARRGRLPSSRSQRQVLVAVQSELQADAELAATFSAFTSLTTGAAMPKIERLPAWRTLAGWRAFLKRRIMLVIAASAALVAVLAPAGVGRYPRPLPYRLRRLHAHPHS